MRNQDNSGQTGTRRLTQQLTEAAVLLKDYEIPKLNLINYVFRKCATPNLKNSKTNQLFSVSLHSKGELGNRFGCNFRCTDIYKYKLYFFMGILMQTFQVVEKE